MKQLLAKDLELTLDEMLDEPIVRLVMASDGVSRADVKMLLRNLQGMRREGDRRVVFRLSAADRSQDVISMPARSLSPYIHLIDAEGVIRRDCVCEALRLAEIAIIEADQGSAPAVGL